jgi:hypothetical protein
MVVFPVGKRRRQLLPTSAKIKEEEDGRNSKKKNK